MQNQHTRELISTEKIVTWCLTPSQPLQLYQGKAQKMSRKHNKDLSHLW